MCCHCCEVTHTFKTRLNTSRGDRQEEKKKKPKKTQQKSASNAAAQFQMGKHLWFFQRSELSRRY